MAELHSLTDRPRPKRADPVQYAEPAKGELVALPFIELNTVVKTMKMLRRFPDQRVLDCFNRAPVPESAKACRDA